MIIEVVDIRIKPGQQKEFDAAIIKGVTEVISNSKGFIGFRILKGVESPERYLLTIRWRKLEDHTVGFRESPAFHAWREIVSPYFAAPPVVEHFDPVAEANV
jgi:heme-degrading monooxygenase HmoA